MSVQQSNTRGLIVISEDQDTRTLLIHEIQSQDIYQRQGGAQPSLCFPSCVPSCSADCQHQAHTVHCMLKELLLAEETIITWSDAEIGTDVALSFQEADGCNSVWYAAQYRFHTASMTVYMPQDRSCCHGWLLGLAVTAMHTKLMLYAASW